MTPQRDAKLTENYQPERDTKLRQRQKLNHRETENDLKETTR